MKMFRFAKAFEKYMVILIHFQMMQMKWHIINDTYFKNLRYFYSKFLINVRYSGHETTMFMKHSVDDSIPVD